MIQMSIVQSSETNPNDSIVTYHNSVVNF